MPVASLARPQDTRTGMSAAAVLDAMPDATAVVDRDGAIVAVNAAWRMFTLDNGGVPDSTGPGVNYLDVCTRSSDAGCADATAVADGLRAVLRGDTVECDLEYPCPSPAAGRWFVLRITPIAGPEPGALVTHVNISRRKAAERELERRASEDPLTGLANRARFTQRLSAALTARHLRPAGADVGLLYLDLDGFKPVNDTFGHAAGDEVLQTVAARLQGVVRPQDTVARLGGDEFAVVAPRMTESGLAGLCGRVSATLAEPHRVHGHSVVVSASAGAYLAAAGQTVQECLQRADAAMYEVKRSRADTRGGALRPVAAG